MEAASSKAQPMLVAGRHIVGLAVAMAPVSALALSTLSVETWLIAVAATLAFAGIVAGLAALFFTKSQARHWLRNFIITAWVTTGLIALGGWGSIQQRRADSSAPAAAAFDPSTARPIEPSK